MLTYQYGNNCIYKIETMIKRIFITTLTFVLFTLGQPANAQTHRWLQLGNDIDGEAAYDLSGAPVSLSADGKTIAITANANDNANGIDAGHVRVYYYNDGNWLQKGSDIDGKAANNRFGHSISLNSDGNIVAMGAPNGNYSQVYQYNGDDWIQLGADILGEGPVDALGSSVSLNSDGSIVAIGAHGNSGENGGNSGHVRIYQYIEGEWIQLGTDIDGEAAWDNSGYYAGVSLSAKGNIVAIGAPYNDGNGTDAGHVRVYQFDGEDWSQLGADIDGEAAGDYSGSSVSLSAEGNIVAIGAYYNAGVNGERAGHVRVYQYTNETWIQLGTDIDGEAAYDISGQYYSVSINTDGNIVAIGARENDENGLNSGHVRVYQFDGEDWSQLGADIDGEAAFDESGWSVSLDSTGNIVAIGALYNDGTGVDAGHTRLFKLCTNTYSTDTQTACNTFTWIDGNIYTSNNNTATYMLTNAAGCDSLITLDLIINIVDTMITVSEFTITANAVGATYQWLDCDNENIPIEGETEQSFAATKNGHYAVEVTQNNCTAISECVEIKGIGISEETLIREVKLYPNPTNGNTILEVIGLKNITIFVTDITGKEIYRDEPDNDSRIIIPATNFRKGLYLVKIQNSNYQKIVKMIKN